VFFRAIFLATEPEIIVAIRTKSFQHPSVEFEKKYTEKI
jgi:hypothetical protein